MTIANELPLLGKEKLRKILVNRYSFSIFVALATVILNSTISCRLKIHHYKVMPGSAVVRLVTVASFPTSIAPGSLVFIPSYFFTSKLATNG